MIEGTNRDRLDRSPRPTSGLAGVGGLECRLGLGRIVLPTASISLLGEYVVGSRLPLNDALNYAIGVWGDTPILSVSLSRHEPAAARSTSGALLVATQPVDAVDLVDRTGRGGASRALVDGRGLPPAVSAAGWQRGLIDIGWAFEMDEPLGLVEVVELAKPSTSIPWRRSARLADGRTVQFIDVPLMLAEVVVE